MLTLAAVQSVRSALEMHFNMTLFCNTDRYQSPFELFALTEILQVPMEILEDEKEEMMQETTVYKHDLVLNLFDDVEEEEAIMRSTVLHVALPPVDAVLHQDLDETLFSPEEDQYVTHCASSSSPNLQSALDKERGAVACSSPMWCAEWEPFRQRTEYGVCTQKSNQYSDCLMTEEFLLHQGDAQQDDDLCLKDYHQDYHQTLTSSLTFDQTVPSFTTRDIHSLQDEEKLLDSYSTPAKSCKKRPLTTPEKPPSKRILAALPASPGRPLSTATNLWIDILFQSSVESLETTIKELHTWLDSTATDGDDAQQVDGPCLHGDVSSENQLNSEQLMEDKENTSTATDGDGVHGILCLKGPEAPVVTPTEQDGDAEAVTRAQEEGHVDVVFPGNVSQDGCCQFVIEILKCVLYQRQQLPMTYDQLKCSQRCRASKQEEASCRAVQSTDLSWRKSERSLQELDMLLGQLEELFSLSLVPRVLLLLGGSLVLPKELYEINMEALVLSRRDQCLQVSSCLRQLFRTLLVADVFSDTAPVRLMSATILVLAHRECGVGWFRPKLDFKVPTRVKRQVIALSTTDTENLQTDWKDYVWFQAPTVFKGFSSS